jgi:hypothetical protein
VRAKEPHPYLWAGFILHERGRIAEFCYNPTLITAPKTSHIQIISAFFAASTITADVGTIYGHDQPLFDQLLQNNLWISFWGQVRRGLGLGVWVLGLLRIEKRAWTL